MKIFIAIFLLNMSLMNAYAKPIENRALEQQSQTLFTELRCMVCEGQSLAGSDTPLAQEMRALVREKLIAGETPEDIKVFFVTRYGEAILQSPPINGHTAVLWAFPLILAALGILIIVFCLAKNNASPPSS